jgi:hypothetical protein
MQWDETFRATRRAEEVDERLNLAEPDFALNPGLPQFNQYHACNDTGRRDLKLEISKSKGC